MIWSCHCYPEPTSGKVKSRFNQVIQPCLLIVYMLHPKYVGEHLSIIQVETTKCWLMEFLGASIVFQAQADPLPAIFLQFCTVTWWKGFQASITLLPRFVYLMIKVHTAYAFSSSIERVISSFGIIHSKLKTRLRLDKAKKLMFCYRILRGGGEHY